MSQSPDSTSGNSLQLLLATGAFGFCFAVFGSVSAMMPIIRKQLGLSPIQVSVAIAIPVLLGSIGRIPLGILTDRFGGKLIFPIVMACSVVPAMLMEFVSEYWQLVSCGLFIGIALASFSVGAGFVSGWYPPAKQGTALGIYGIQRVQQMGQDDHMSWMLIPLLGFTIAGCALQAILFALKTPEAWNARYNPDAAPDAPAGRTQWITIGAIIVALMVGTAVLMASLAFSFQRYFEYQIEEARKISQ